MLVKEGAISKKQLEEGIHNQVIFGGRLGTNLVELGYLDEQTLTKWLAKKHGVPTVNWNSLNRIKPSVLKLFTKKLAKITESFPIKEEGKDLYVVMADPDNLEWIQQISFATGKKVKPLVLPEVRVFDLLTRFYNIGRELRYINLAMMYKVKEEEKPSDQPAFAAAGKMGLDREALKEREQIRLQIDFGRSEDLLSEEEFQRMTGDQYAEKAAAGPEPAPGPEPSAPAPAPAPAAPEAMIEPTPPPPAEAPPPPPRPGSPEQYRKTAQVLYSILLKQGVTRYIDKGTLQEFIKLFVKNQLKHQVLSMNFLANWLIIEANAPVEWLEGALSEFKNAGPSLGIAVALPGEPLPERPAAPAPAAEPEPLEPEEVIEEPSPPPAEAPLEAVEVLELGQDDMASLEEIEEFAPIEEPEEEEAAAAEELVELTLAEAKDKLLSEVQDRKDISRIVLGFAQGFFKRSLLFTVRKQTLFGWDGRGPGIDSGLVESIMLPLAEPSVFQLVNMTGSFFLGPVPPGPINGRFLKLLGGQQPNNAFIMPVVVNEKVVYMLYGDNGEGEFVPVNAPELQILAYQIPRALEMLIKRKKAAVSAA